MVVGRKRTTRTRTMMMLVLVVARWINPKPKIEHPWLGSVSG